MSIRKFNVNKTESEIALASTLFPGFMSKEDKIALDALVAANFQGGSITEVTINVSGLDEVTNRLTNLETTVNSLKSKLDEYPVLTSAMKTDGQGYLLVNNVFEPVFPANCSPLYEEGATATSIVLASLESGKLEITEETEPEIIEEVHAMLGDELFNELAANNFSTLELHPQIPEEEKVKQAIEEYYNRKLMNQKYLDVQEAELDVIDDSDIKRSEKE